MKPSQFWYIAWYWKILVVLLVVYYTADLPKVVDDISFIVCHSGIRLLQGMWALTPRYLRTMRDAANAIEGEPEVEALISKFWFPETSWLYYTD